MINTRQLILGKEDKHDKHKAINAWKRRQA